MGGEDEHALALRRRRLLVAEDHRRVVRAGQVGEDDPGGVVMAVGQGPSQPARPVSELGDSPIARAPASPALTRCAERWTRDTVAMETPARRATS